MQLLSQSYSTGAAEWLSSNNKAHVFSSFERACNLIDEQGRFIAVVHNKIGNGPFAMVLEELPFSLDKMLSVGTPVVVGKNSLTVNTTTIDFSEATLWSARVDWDYPKDRPHHFNKNIHDLYLTVQNNASDESLSSMLCSNKDNVGYVCTKVAEAAQQLYRGIVSDNIQKIYVSAANMAGLGVGLTPAGDDFLVGVMYALWSIFNQKDAARWSRTIAAAAASHTTMLSGAMLQESANGHACEHWHALVDVLCKENVTDVTQACMDILSLGHTSGADALAGFLLSIDYLSDHISLN
ncbi:MAG TPA: hypothetical protein DGN60_09025 [Chloroflexi bacterium]|nr:hypothetical protein [Chloroflexota bacterium]